MRKPGEENQYIARKPVKFFQSKIDACPLDRMEVPSETKQNVFSNRCLCAEKHRAQMRCTGVQCVPSACIQRLLSINTKLITLNLLIKNNM